jgi:hypothetical protein
MPGQANGDVPGELLPLELTTIFLGFDRTKDTDRFAKRPQCNLRLTAKAMRRARMQIRGHRDENLHGLLNFIEMGKRLALDAGRSLGFIEKWADCSIL